MIILGILASVAVARFNDLENSSRQTAINSAISDLNGREGLTWANQKISHTGYTNDQDIVNAIDYNPGNDYTWSVAPGPTGGILEFKGLSVTLNRTPSTASQPAFWSR